MASEESGGGRLSPGKLKDLIERDFKSVDDMKKQVNAAAMALQGSGWVWLGINVGNKRLGIATTPNQDTLVDLVPLIAIDLWEHSFYIQYKNKKVDYLTNIWHVINFQTAEQRLRSVLEHL